MRNRFVFTSFLAVGAIALLTNAGGCGGNGDGSDFGPGGDGDGGGAGDGTTGDGPQVHFGDGGGGDGSHQCVGLQCNVKTCSGGGHTTISGKVYDPAGKQPLYNVVVYVPTDPKGVLPPIKTGTNSCNTCDAAIDNIVTATLTDETGSFTLKDVPSGSQIPLVMQIGKWRREVFLPQINDCVDNPAPASATRLPKNKSEGDMPQMALLTGGCDPLGCLFSRIGIDPAEFTGPSGAGRMHVYKGVGGQDVTGGGAADCTGTTCPLWTQKSQLEKYDIVLLSCECDEQNQTKPNKVPMHDWINEGGKAFATHYHYTWFKNGPADFAGTANWGAGANSPFVVDTTFPKGQSFVKWLQNVGALTGTNQININAGDVRNDVTTVTAPAKGGQRWIYSPSSGGTAESDKYYSFATPIGGNPPGPDAGPDAGPSYCGKAVFSDIHVSGTETATVIPSGCSTNPLTPQEKALEFLFFDLSACVQNDQQPPQPPQPR